MSIFLSCSCGPGFPLSTSAKTEIKGFCQLLADRKTGQIISRKLTKDEFERDIYPHLPEAKQKSPMPVDDYWMISTYKNGNAINAFYYKFKYSKKIKFKKLGKALKKKVFDDITIYNRVPVYFSDENGREFKFERLISAVACTKDKCSLWSADTED